MNTWDGKVTQELQSEHDKRHPGLVCQNCPRELESQRRLREAADRLAMPDWRLTTRGRWVVAVGWVLVTGTLGWFAYDIANWVWGR